MQSKHVTWRIRLGSSAHAIPTRRVTRFSLGTSCKDNIQDLRWCRLPLPPPTVQDGYNGILDPERPACTQSRVGKGLRHCRARTRCWWVAVLLNDGVLDLLTLTVHPVQQFRNTTRTATHASGKRSACCRRRRNGPIGWRRKIDRCSENSKSCGRSRRPTPLRRGPRWPQYRQIAKLPQRALPNQPL